MTPRRSFLASLVGMLGVAWMGKKATEPLDAATFIGEPHVYDLGAPITDMRVMDDRLYILTERGLWMSVDGGRPVRVRA